MSKLLNKPFKIFTLYALIVLACSIPAYYLVVDAIWLEELDEHNQIIRGRIANGIRKVDLNEAELKKTISAWNTIQPGTKLIRSSTYGMDRVYTYTTYDHYERDVNRYRVLSTYIEIHGEPYQLTIATNLEEVDETLLAIALVTSLFFILLIGGFVVLNRRIARKIWNPFRNTLNKLKTFELNEGKTVQFVPSGIEEFEALNYELTLLIEKNIAVYKQQKSFIENASHELQTPLAVLQTKIDLLLQNDDLTEEQSRIVLAIANHLARISRINKNLLLLAKIENNQFSEMSVIDASDVLRDSIELLEDYAADKAMNVHVNFEKCGITANKALLEILFNNLLINAIFHGEYGDTIQILVCDAYVKFSNSGSKTLHTAALFKRFTVLSSDTTRSGLGLAITWEICNRYGWKLSYDFVADKHTFTVRF